MSRISDLGYALYSVCYVQRCFELMMMMMIIIIIIMWNVVNFCS